MSRSRFLVVAIAQCFLDRVSGLWPVTARSLELDGEDLRPRPLAERKAMLRLLLDGAPAGIRYNDHCDAPGADVYRLACHMALEGIVSKRADLP